MLTVFIVSDGTGATAERVARAALVQFANVAVTTVKKTQIRTPELIREVVREARQSRAIIIHTLVAHELRRLMLQECRQQGIDAMDLMGPVLDRLAMHLHLQPQEEPGLFRQLTEARSRTIEAVEFAFHHDDGQNADGLAAAEVVLVGPSRSMKTPTMLYLAYRGWFAANVPLVPESEPPAALLELPPQKVFGLSISPDRLLDLRRARAEAERIPHEVYASPAEIRRELLYASDLCRRYRWHQVDVTGKSVEELSQELIALMPERPTG